MVASILVSRQIEEGEKLLRVLDKNGMHVEVAFWTAMSDGDYWRLMLGKSGINQQGTRETYGEIYQLLKDNTINMSLDEVSVIDIESDLCVALRKAIQANPINGPVAFVGRFVDGQSFPDSIVYRVNG